jgi:Fic family protein
MAKDRESQADEPQLLTDRGDIARKEAQNTLRQFDATMRELDAWIKSGNEYQLRPSVILALNGVALQDISGYAGVYRPGSIRIGGSRHKPVEAAEVPRLVEEFCDYINKNWLGKSAIHLAAYSLWRLNWIHPFVDGNGRTARVISYLVMCAKLGHRLPGNKTIPEQISENKQPYYKALEQADSAWSKRKIDVSMLESLIDGHLANQLLQVHDHATGGSREREAIATSPALQPALNASSSGKTVIGAIVQHLERYPVIYGTIVAVALAIAGYYLAR